MTAKPELYLVEREKSKVIENVAQLHAYFESVRWRAMDYQSTPDLKLASFDFPPFIDREIPIQYAELFRCVPLASHEHGLIVAVDEMANIDRVARNLSFVTSRHVEVLACPQDVIDTAFDAVYKADVLTALCSLEPSDSAPIDLERMDKEIGERPMVRVVARILIEAYRKGASDIHLRQDEDSGHYLLRLNGNLVMRSEINKEHISTIIRRFKILGEMNSADSRACQDGGAKVVVGGHQLDLRMSIVPCIHGESLVVRILHARDSFTLDQLGMSDREFNNIYTASKQSHGLILSIGPTGAGKSATMYAILKEISKNQALNIVTVEDPVEIHLSGVNQIQVNRKAGETFASTLRQMVRHDPDVIMIGEIRDAETAKIAIECAMSGHLVLSTLHSINSATAIPRLMEMGIKPYMLKTVLSLLLSQRLAKINCQHCSAPDDSEEAKILRSIKGVSDIKFQAGIGCDKCNYSGISGRTGCFESLPVNMDLRAEIHENVSEAAILSLARKNGYVSVSSHAKSLARKGLISATEWIRLQVDDNA